MDKTRGHHGKLFIISAPSGCGKTTLSNRILAGGLGLVRSVSMTTRKPRPGEKDGLDYHFVSPKAFKGIIDKDGFLEYEENFGNLYGTPKKLLEDNLKDGRSLLLDIDVKGALKVKKAYPKESVLIFILPPKIKELKKRLHLRRSEDAGTMKRRLDLAKKEIAFKDRYDHKVVNDDLEHAYKKLRKIILSELKRKTGRD
ncbi:MAG: guanylate kinase [Spirochaetales bacterium]|nr:MAG: guanylate kinase [Spirochaetales bacterium]